MPTLPVTSHKLISLVIPCCNEADVLPLLFDRIQNEVKNWSYAYEVILIDDGSTDATWELMQQFHDQDHRWKAVKLSRNFGHQLALWTGLQHAQGDAVVVLDADLQDPPEVVPQFLEQWQAGYDVVFAIRRKRKEGMLKRAAYFCYYRFLKMLSEIHIPLDSGDFCVMDRRVVQALLSCNEQEPFIRGLRAWVGFRQTGLTYERAGRAAGEVKYTFSKLVKLGLNGIFSFSTKPLKLATWLGITCSSLAFLAGVFVLIRYLFAEQLKPYGVLPVPGYASIIIAVLFLGGLQLVSLGIVGAYIGRIFQEVKGRPLTFVSESVGLVEKQIPGVHHFPKQRKAA
ncbi:MAG: glycosyltransferase family 2 protein [Planctomycetia bacterium]|nr:glycosyltransferase family 2 protein [Planctomycetia bacterium]